jgi:hypothetical protein
LDKIAFELSVILLGASSTVRAWLAVETAGIAPAVMALAIISIGLGCMLRWLRFLSNVLIAVGTVSFFGAALLPSQLVRFNYGHHAAGDVAGLAAVVMSGGTLSDTWSTSPHAFVSAPVSRQGHRYVSLNSLGAIGVDQTRVVQSLVDDLDSGFPLTVTGPLGTRVVPGNQLTLGSIVTNDVTTVALAPGRFSLRTQPDHFLMGTAHHGVVADRQGGLWLFQYGEGLPGEPAYKQLVNYALADVMWAKMAERIRRNHPIRKNAEGPAPSAAPPVQPHTPPDGFTINPRRAPPTVTWQFRDGAEGWSARNHTSSRSIRRGGS